MQTVIVTFYYLKLSDNTHTMHKITVTSYKMAQLGSEHPFMGSEPAFIISLEVTKKAVRDWTNRDHRKQ
jgi:hypothetical protein